MSTPIQPPFRLYTLRVEVGSMGSPHQPVVTILQEDMHDGLPITQHSITPEQARTLAADLIAAADETQTRSHSCPICAQNTGSTP